LERDQSAATPDSLKKSALKFLKVCFEIEGDEKLIPAEEVGKLTGASFIPWLEIKSQDVYFSLCKHMKKLKEPRRLDWLWNFWGIPKKEIPIEQVWRGNYYQKEIELLYLPDVVLRWIHPDVGWGVFARRSFKKREYLAEYTGVLRKRQKGDEKNSYCFEYAYSPEEPSPFLIDARDQGGISRYINHSSKGNLEPVLASLGSLTHVILLANRPIQKGEQLSYNYGPDYWARRLPPLELEKGDS